MAPTKHATTKKPSSKCVCTDFDHFKSANDDMKYNDCYKGATIIMEKVVHLESKSIPTTNSWKTLQEKSSQQDRLSQLVFLRHLNKTHQGIICET